MRNTGLCFTAGIVYAASSRSRTELDRDIIGVSIYHLHGQTTGVGAGTSVTVARVKRFDQPIILHVLNCITTDFLSTSLTLKHQLDI
jgi:hypothetical protein